MGDMLNVSVVLPVYNEESCIEQFLASMVNFLRSQGNAYKFQLILVDDGSLDTSFTKILNTFDILGFESLKRTSNPLVNTYGSESVVLERSYRSNNIKALCLKLRTNKGQTWATREGLRYTEESDLIATMDSDGQHPLPVLMDMILESKAYSAVCARQIQRRDNFTKAIMSNLYYIVFETLLKANLPPTVGEFRVMKSSLVRAINVHPNSMALRIAVPAMSRHLKVVDYVPLERESGESKYTLQKMLKLGISFYKAKRYIDSTRFKEVNLSGEIE
jgi:glycosyltransferase involved in cell wall biosynthesis